MVDAKREMDWKRYAVSVVLFSAVGTVIVYALQRLQGGLPLNPQDFPGTTSDLAYNTATSFASNTNWQAYGGETTMSYLTQMLGLTVQNFVSAATGIAVLIALIRGFTRRSTSDLGNFWVDLTRCTLWILMPLAIILTVLLVSQGVIQNLDSYKEVTTLEGAKQILAMGPAASQIAIKQLGTNGGGFFNVNSAMPFENPTPFSNFLEVVAIFLIPAGLTYTFGKMVKDTRQGWAIFAAMSVLFLAGAFITYAAEQRGNPNLTDAWRQPGLPERRPRQLRRQHGGQGRTLRHRRLHDLGRRRPPTPPTAPSTPCTTATRRWAAWCRCSTCTSARWSSAASAPAST